MDYSVLYLWAKHDVLREVYVFTSLKRIRKLRHAQSLSRIHSDQDLVVIPCNPTQPVCSSCCSGEPPFCFFYEMLFTRLNFRLPLTAFEKEVLSAMNVAPAQLHPNSWAFVRAFYILCCQLNFVPSATMFFYFFEYKPSKRTSWASVSGAKGRAILTLFQSSYKSFKGRFIKIQKTDQNPDFFEGFPLYWSSNPQSQQTRSPDNLERNEFNDYKNLDDLGIVFETSILLKLEFQPHDLKVNIGTYFY